MCRSACGTCSRRDRTGRRSSSRCSGRRRCSATTDRHGSPVGAVMSHYFSNVTVFDGRTVKSEAGGARRGRNDRVDRAARARAEDRARRLRGRGHRPHAHTRPDRLSRPSVVRRRGRFRRRSGGAHAGDRRDQSRAQRDPTPGARRHDRARPGRGGLGDLRRGSGGRRGRRPRARGSWRPAVRSPSPAATVTTWRLRARSTGPDDVRQAVREEIKGGARVIKVMATGGVLTPGIDATFTAFTPEELRPRWTRRTSGGVVWPRMRSARKAPGTPWSPVWTPSSTASR